METATLSHPPQRVTELRGASAVLQSCTARRVVTEGRAGTGKTAGHLWKVHSWCENYDKLRVALVRKSAIDVKKTILKTFEEFVLPEHSPIKEGQSRLHRTHYDYPGTKAHIGIYGLDDPADLFSSEWDLIYAAEGIQFEQSTIGLLSRSLRNFRGPYHQLMIDLNPGSPNHWANLLSTPAGNELRMMTDRAAYDRLQAWNSRAVDVESQQFHRLISVHQDNPQFWDFDAWDYLDNGREYIRNLKDMTGPDRERMLNGLWTAAEGAVFKNEFQSTKNGRPWHVVPYFEPPADWPGFIAVDPGYAHVLALLVGVVAPNGRKYVVGERVIAERTIPDHAAWITQYQKAHKFIIRKKLGDPHDMFKHTLDGNGRSKAEQFADHGHVFEPAPNCRNNAEIAAQVDEIRTALVTVLADGEPELQFMDSAPMLINGMQSWAYKRNAKGALSGGEDQFDEAYKDEADAVRMFIASRPAFSHPKARAL